MLIHISDDFYSKVLMMSEALDSTPEIVLEKQFYTSNLFKDVPISEKADFIQFVSNYRKIIDDLIFLSDNTDYYLNQVDHSLEMKKVFLKLNTLLEEDINFITKLYLVYKGDDINS